MAEIEVDAGGSWWSRRWVIVVAVVLVFVMAATLFIGLAEGHSGKLRIVRDDATRIVQVERGRYAPLGWTPYRPTEAFRPVELDADIPLVTGECSNVGDCEARLFEAVAEQARRLLRRRERLRDASVLISQAVKLSGEGNVSQRLALEGDEQYVRGLIKLEDAAGELLDATRHFRRARAMGSQVFQDSHIRWRQSLELLDALRRSGVQIAEMEPGELDVKPDEQMLPGDAPKRPPTQPVPREPTRPEAPPTGPTPDMGEEGGTPPVQDWSEL